jgi:hypothetical protein
VTTKVGRSLLRLQSTQSQGVDPEQADMNSSANLSENNSLEISWRRE